MRAEDRHRARRDLIDLVDELRPFRAQPLDDVPVMHDLVPHVDRGPVFLERPLDDLDRAFDPGAEPTRLGQHHSQHSRHLLDNAPSAGGFAGGRAVVVYPCHSSRAARNAATLLHI